MHRSDGDTPWLLAVGQQAGRDACGPQLGLGGGQGGVGPGCYADVARVQAAGDPALDRFDQAGDLLGSGLVADQLWRGAVEGRAVAGQGLRAVVEVVEGLAGQQAERPVQDLVGGAVVDPEAVGASSDLDAHFRQAHPVVVDPLVGVADEEEVVLVRRY